MSDKPRAYTAEECRDIFMRQISTIVKYWSDERRDFGSVKERVSGAAFSILVMLDGGSIGTPAFDLTPAPHPDDEESHKGEGENWWPTGVVINGCQLHEMLYKFIPRSTLDEGA